MDVTSAGVVLSVAREGFRLAGAVLHVQTAEVVGVPEIHL